MGKKALFTLFALGNSFQKDFIAERDSRGVIPQKIKQRYKRKKK